MTGRLGILVNMRGPHQRMAESKGPRKMSCFVISRNGYNPAGSLVGGHRIIRPLLRILPLTRSETVLLDASCHPPSRGINSR